MNLSDREYRILCNLRAGREAFYPYEHVQRMVESGLLVDASSFGHGEYQLTGKGQEALKQAELPVPILV